MLEHAHPGLLLIASGALLPALPARLRAVVAPLLPAAALALVWLAEGGGRARWLGFELSPLEPDALSRLFATAFCLVAGLGALFAVRHARARELSFSLIYAGSALLVTLAGDWLTLFVGWELMAVSSTVVVWCGGTEAARRAGLRYLAVHALSGVLLLAGLAALVVETGSLALAPVTTDGPARWLLLGAVLVNAGAPPLSAWIPDAYPESSPTGTVFLSAFTTKSAVYLLLRAFPGTDLLVPFGLFMIFHGIVHALLEDDMRRLLAYSILSQVGFMVVGAGIGTPLAVSAAAAHAFAHLLYKSLLVMAAGSVLIATGRRRCSELGGLRHALPWTAGCAVVGALAICSFPLTSGFVSKSLIQSAAAQEHLAVTWFLLVAASAGTVLYAGLKFPWLVFFHRDRGLRPAEPGWSLRAAMLLAAAACILPGVLPGSLHALLPHPVDEAVYSPAHVVTQLQLLLFAGLAFFLVLPLLERGRGITLDWDWLWRVPGRALASRAGAGLERLGELADAAGERLSAGLLPADDGAGRGGAGWPLWVSLFLIASLLGSVLAWNVLT